MKTLLSLFLLLAVGASAATGIKISEYPNTPVLTNSELFIVAVTNVTPATNRNISYGQLRSLLASNNFVGSFTGEGRNVSNVVASYVSGTISNNISGNAAMATNWAGAVFTNGNVGFGTQTPTNLVTIKGNAATAYPTYGSEFLSAAGWTSVDWTGNWSPNGWSHTTNNTTVLSQSTPAVNATKYHISYTVTNRTSGSFTLSFGGTSLAGITATGDIGPTSTTTGNLTITPTSDFDGTVILSIKAIVSPSSAIIQLVSDSELEWIDVRIPGVYGGNTAIGYRALEYDTSGTFNTAVGWDSLWQNTSGSDNTAVGLDSMLRNTTGSGNVAVGTSALNNNTSGLNNSAIGMESMSGNLTGNYNAAFGKSSLTAVTSGSYNSAIGYYTLGAITTGNKNTALGTSAGYYMANGSTPLTAASNSVYIGYGANGFSDADNNSIVIGYNATGIGANSVVLGNDSITTTALKGNVGIGTNAPWIKQTIVGSVSSPSLAGHNSNGILALNSGVNWGELDFGEYGIGSYAFWMQARSDFSGVSLPLSLNPLGGYVGINTASPSEALDVSGNISASGAVIATNAFVMPPVSAGPVWCTNGLAAMWNSNTTVYIRTSAVGATTYADKLVAP